jgi:hypothetical protein
VTGLALAALLPAGPAAADTFTVDDTGAADFTTIQEAVDAAASGDTILIRPNSDSRGWRENVVVATANLTLRGDTVAANGTVNSQTCPTVFLDGCETPADPTGCDANVVSVQATGVIVERVFLRHGYVEFTATGGDSTFRESCVLGDTSLALRNANPGPNAFTIDRNVFQGGTAESVDLWGNNHAVTGNRFFTSDSSVEIVGDDMRVIGNAIRGCNDRCFYLSGDRATVANNQVIGGDGHGINIYGDGDGHSITGNFISGVSASEILALGLDDPDPELRREAAVKLAERDDPSAAAALEWAQGAAGEPR